jgi:hypothetical protein
MLLRQSDSCKPVVRRNFDVYLGLLEPYGEEKQTIPMANAVDISSIRPPPDKAGRDESASKLTQGSDRRQLVDALAESVLVENAEMMRELAR